MILKSGTALAEIVLELAQLSSVVELNNFVELNNGIV